MSDKKFTIQYKKASDKSAKVNVEGELSLMTINEIHQKHIEINSKYSELEVTISKVTKIDLAFLQVLCALKESSAKFTLEMDLTEDSADLIENSGLNSILKA